MNAIMAAIAGLSLSTLMVGTLIFFTQPQAQSVATTSIEWDEPIEWDEMETATTIEDVEVPVSSLEPLRVELDFPLVDESEGQIIEELVSRLDLKPAMKGRFEQALQAYEEDLSRSATEVRAILDESWLDQGSGEE